MLWETLSLTVMSIYILVCGLDLQKAQTLLESRKHLLPSVCHHFSAQNPAQNSTYSWKEGMKTEREAQSSYRRHRLQSWQLLFYPKGTVVFPTLHFRRNQEKSICPFVIDSFHTHARFIWRRPTMSPSSITWVFGVLRSEREDTA